MIQYLVEPWKHQREVIEKSGALPNFGLFFEAGTGKTATTINILRGKFAAEKRMLRTLVLCPPIVIDNWKREFGMHSKISQERIVLLNGTGKQRLEKFLEADPVSQNIFITNFETLLMPANMAALQAWKPEVLVVDECHKCKDGKSKRTKAVTALADTARYRFILSGTPILNSPMDIFWQFRILDGGTTFGKNFFAFRARYFYDKNAGMPPQKYFPDWRVRPGALEDINLAISKVAKTIKKSECLDLPPLVKKTVFVGMTKEQARMYEEMKNDFITYVRGEACVAQLAITKALRLQQIVSGFISLENRNDGMEGPAPSEKARRTEHNISGNPRAQALKALLEDITTHSKVLVWAVFRQNYGQIKEVCDELKLQYVELNGDTPAGKRVEFVDRFNRDPSCKVFIGHPGSGGIGINLVAASYSIFYSRSFSLEFDIQAEARNYRGGSEVHEKVTRIDLVTPGTIDEVVLRRLASKQDISDKLLTELAHDLAA
jgi:SNF2 family DNA or RNA helicase